MNTAVLPAVREEARGTATGGSPWDVVLSVSSPGPLQPHGSACDVVLLPFSMFCLKMYFRHRACPSAGSVPKCLLWLRLCRGRPGSQDLSLPRGLAPSPVPLRAGLDRKWRQGPEPGAQRGTACGRQASLLLSSGQASGTAAVQGHTCVEARQRCSQATALFLKSASGSTLAKNTLFS